VAEFHLEDGKTKDYYNRKSSKAQRLSGVHKRLIDGVSDWTRKWALPDDLMHRYEKKDIAASEEDNNDNCNGEEEDSTTIMSSKKNCYKVVNQKFQIRREMEETLSNGRKKQAVAVNKNRSWDGGETLPKGTVCLLKIIEGEEKKSVGVKDLPVVISGLNYYMV
jgi:hypothetical protein